MRQNIGSGGPFEDTYGYCRVVRVGDQIHVSGTTARHPDLEGAGTYEQARSALAIIDKALRDVGSSVEAVVRTVAYVTDIDDRLEVARAHSEVFGEIRPAATLVEVTRLIDPAMKVEIEAYAIETS
ncbi:RidA family protein [Spirillospora sp. CA-294931]|uniref:RidA family protein n=1 Tax=Spirillospora sp. CA-294931 TaxID=3240042 RepID=UPI003D8A5662